MPAFFFEMFCTLHERRQGYEIYRVHEKAVLLNLVNNDPTRHLRRRVEPK